MQAVALMHILKLLWSEKGVKGDFQLLVDHVSRAERQTTTADNILSANWLSPNIQILKTSPSISTCLEK